MSGCGAHGILVRRQLNPRNSGLAAAYVFGLNTYAAALLPQRRRVLLSVLEHRRLAVAWLVRPRRLTPSVGGAFFFRASRCCARIRIQAGTMMALLCCATLGDDEGDRMRLNLDDVRTRCVSFVLALVALPDAPARAAEARRPRRHVPSRLAPRRGGLRSFPAGLLERRQFRGRHRAARPAEGSRGHDHLAHAHPSTGRAESQGHASAVRTRCATTMRSIRPTAPPMT